MSARLLALTLLLLTAIPVAAQRPRPNGDAWTNLHEDAERLSAAVGVTRNSTWGAGFVGLARLEEIDLDCGKVRRNTFDFVDTLDDDQAWVVFGTLNPQLTRYGEYFANDTIVINDMNSPENDWKTLIHEAQHWAGVGEEWIETQNDLDSLELALVDAADYCITFVKEEEDDDPNEGGGEDPTEPVCEEKLVPVYYPVYERELRRSTVCTASDDVDGTGGCSTAYRYVLVPKQKVKWETQTVCSS